MESGQSKSGVATFLRVDNGPEARPQLSETWRVSRDHHLLRWLDDLRFNIVFRFPRRGRLPLNTSSAFILPPPTTMLSPILIGSSKPAFDLPLNHPNISTDSVHFFPIPSPEELALRAPLSPNTSPTSSRPTSMGWLSDATSSDAHNASESEETPASSIAELDSSPAAILLRRGEWLKAMETFPFAGIRAGRKNVEDDNRTERSTFTSISEVTFTPLRAVRRSEPYEAIVHGEEKEGSTSKRITWPLSRSASAAFLRRNTVGAESKPAISSEPHPSPSSSMFRIRSVKGTTELTNTSRPSMVRRALSLRAKAKDGDTAIQHLAETHPSCQVDVGKGEGDDAKGDHDDEDDEELDEATAEARRVAEKINKQWAFEEYTQEEVFQHRFSQYWDSLDTEALSSVADLPQL